MPIVPSPDAASTDAAEALDSATVLAANLHLSRAVCARYLPEAESVALLQRGDRVLLVPLLRHAGSGLLLKQRNARGDRVVHAQEFFRAHGYREDHVPRQISLHWDDTAAALVLSGLARD